MEISVKERLKEFLRESNIKAVDFCNAIGVSSGFIAGMRESIQPSKLKTIATNYPSLNIEWLLTGVGEMLKSATPLSTPAKVEETKPRIPYDAAAGMLSDAMSGLTCADCEQIPVIQSFSKYDYSILVKGDSMEGELKSGDEVFCKDVSTSGFLRWGDIHVLNTSQGVVVKRVYDDGEYILCKSELSEVFKDFRIPKSEIYNIGLVIGVIRRY